MYTLPRHFLHLFSNFVRMIYRGQENNFFLSPVAKKSVLTITIISL